jgi:hypothetical protein
MREMMKDRKMLIGIAGLVLFIIMISVALTVLAGERRDLLRLKEQRKEMIVLRMPFCSSAESQQCGGEEGVIQCAGDRTGG